MHLGGGTGCWIGSIGREEYKTKKKKGKCLRIKTVLASGGLPGREGMGGKQGDRGMWDECARGDGPYRREKIKDGWNKQLLLKCCCSRLLSCWSSLQRPGLLLYHIMAPSAISACKGQRLPQSKECEVEDKEV